MKERLLKEGLDYNNYYSLYKRKRQLVSYLNAYNSLHRFYCLKIPVPSDVQDKLNKAMSEGFSKPSEVHDYINFISLRLKELKRGVN